MERTALIQIVKFFAAVALLASLSAIALLADDQSIRGASIGFVIFLGAPVFFLTLIDTGKLFRTLGESRPHYRMLGRVLGYPQAAFGAVCIFVGIVIIPLLLYRWVVYGYAPTGPWLGAPVGFCVFGFVLLRYAFAAPPAPEPHNSGPEFPDSDT